jgi:hypothetical protein
MGSRLVKPTPAKSIICLLLCYPKKEMSNFFYLAVIRLHGLFIYLYVIIIFVPSSRRFCRQVKHVSFFILSSGRSAGAAFPRRRVSMRK